MTKRIAIGRAVGAKLASDLTAVNTLAAEVKRMDQSVSGTMAALVQDAGADPQSGTLRLVCDGADWFIELLPADPAGGQQ
jgi:hypothetical protein